MALSHSEWTGVSSLNLKPLTGSSSGKKAIELIRQWQKGGQGLKVTKYSENKVHSTVLQVHLGSLYNFHCSFYSPGKQYGCQHMREETQKLSSVTKSQLSISSPVHRGALVPEYPVSEESFIYEPMKGQVSFFFFDSTSRPIKLNVKTTRNSHES